MNHESEGSIDRTTMQFNNLKKYDIRGKTTRATFTFANTHVAYANALRRLILTGVETVAFRADMTSTGSTTDVVINKNDTPMTNEMLAHRIGLLPVNVDEPLKWNKDKYTFKLKKTGSKDNTVYVTASDFEVFENPSSSRSTDADNNVPVTADEPIQVPNSRFFVPNHITGDTCLLATLQPVSGKDQQQLDITTIATIGTGRENARFIPVSQCSYAYTPDTDPVRQEEMFLKWIQRTKKITNELDKSSTQYGDLLREFNTMEVARCYQMNDKGEPYSFDFTLESVGSLTIPYIVQRACEVGESMCNRYVNIDKGELPAELSVSSADSRIIGYDFMFRGHDHTLGNLLQTWLVENHIDGAAEPKVTFAGYSVPHPLRDEFILRIGVEDGEESTARKALAQACKGCVEMFRQMRLAWLRANGEEPAPQTKRKVPRVSAATPPILVTKTD